MFLACLGGFAILWLAVYGWACIYLRYIKSVGSVVTRKFPNGLTLHHICGDGGTNLVYNEIFEDRTYFKNGVSLEGIKKPLVLDIGGNIGFFSLSTSLENPGAQIECFEPVPRLCDAMRANLKKQIAAKDVTVHSIGLGAEEGSFSMVADLGFSAGSSFHESTIKSVLKEATAKEFLHAVMVDFVPMGLAPEQPTMFMASLLKIPVLGHLVFVLYLPLAALMLAWLMGLPPSRKMPVTAKIRPLHAVLKERGLSGKTIDMVKIDVEGAELEVLQGFTDEVWSNVQQIVVETHDIDGRVDKIMAMIKRAGFDNVVEQDEPLLMHQLLKMTTIFASRRKK